ncbi:MAG: Glu-tRNA(Gln) amidotransferase subunit GatD [Candidatus Bathyarchaeia archaeon]|nr:Glu-tRNA(Gln) amidotransferase subunit GatD [Candidatus Bathyarchaeota archaeon]
MAYQALKAAQVSIGDVIRIVRAGEVYEGSLMPRSELGDDKHIVIKLASGYNIGVRVTSDCKIERIGVGSKPTYTYMVREVGGRNLPRVDVISTGGTIASRVDYRTGAVEPALSASDLYNAVPELSELADIRAHILYSELSENITPKHWSGMASKIFDVIRSGASGVVVCHGTDTMGYTSAALSFALRNLPVPVVLVGSQRSSDRPSSDAATNLVGAVASASKAPFATVAVAMHESTSDDAILLHRGTRVRKCHTSGRYAFKSINSPPLAKYILQTGQLEVYCHDIQKRDPERNVELKNNFEERVLHLKFYPGMRAEIIDWAIVEGYRGIVIEGTGLGHVSRTLQDPISRAVKNGILVGMTSQCLYGRVNMNVYATGRDLLSVGVQPLEDMIPETALVKVMWALGQTDKVEEAERILKTNIEGEISQRTLYDDPP